MIIAGPDGHYPCCYTIRCATRLWHILVQQQSKDRKEKLKHISGLSFDVGPVLMHC
jgi:hypothetical protein